MHALKPLLYLLEIHSTCKSFVWTSTIRIDTEGNSLLMKLGPVPNNTLIRIRLNPIYFMQNYKYFKQFY